MIETIMQSHGETLVLLVLGGITLLSVLIGLFNGRAVVQLKKSQLQQHKQNQEDLRALSVSAVGMGHKVLETERKLNESLKKQFTILNSQPEHPSYDQASRLIAMGATEKDLVETCGFSFSEAELLLSLNRHRPETKHQTLQ